LFLSARHFDGDGWIIAGKSSGALLSLQEQRLWVNIIAVRDEGKDQPRVATFVEACQSNAVKQVITRDRDGDHLCSAEDVAPKREHCDGIRGGYFLPSFNARQIWQSQKSNLL
jgi:hypothetical protein